MFWTNWFYPQGELVLIDLKLLFVGPVIILTIGLLGFGIGIKHRQKVK